MKPLLFLLCFIFSSTVFSETKLVFDDRTQDPFFNPEAVINDQFRDTFVNALVQSQEEQLESNANSFGMVVSFNARLPISSLRYVNLTQMERYLNYRFKKISADQASNGDIVVYTAKKKAVDVFESHGRARKEVRPYQAVVHTAVLVDSQKGIIFQKDSSSDDSVYYFSSIADEIETQESLNTNPGVDWVVPNGITVQYYRDQHPNRR
ncbi:MAG: hypothetical protein ACPGJV_02795 [Bacteriovoracaceae bacterium]